MSDTTPLKPAEPHRQTAQRARRAGISLIWLVPLMALGVVGGVAWQTVQNRGTLIEVAFKDATGITPGETALKFREIAVGKVEAIRFTDDLASVVAEIRVDRDVARYIDADAEFWLVTPEVSARGVSRIDTVLTGAFIEGYWDAEIGAPQDRYAALDRPPLTRDDAKGLWVTLTTETAEGLSEGAPVMYRGLQVGRMENLRVDDDGTAVLVDVFVEAPHDARVSTATSFWDTSGVSFGLGAAGVSVNVNSLASLIQGGVQFNTFASGGQPVTPGHVFTLNPDEETARANLFAADQGAQARYTLLLPDAVRGLAEGADVQFKGLSVGRVTDLSVRVDDDGKAYQQINLSISPARLGLGDGADAGDVGRFLETEVANGLRARIGSSGLLGTKLVVELVPVPDAAPAEIDATGQPYPILPSVRGQINDLSDTAQGVISRVGNLPIEETLKSAIDMMNAVTALASSQDTQAIPESLRRAIDQTRDTAEDVASLTGDLRRTGAAESLQRLLDEAAEAAASLKSAAANAPDMINSIDQAAQAVNQIDFAQVSQQAEGILRDLRAMLGTADAEQLPRNLSDTLAAASGLLNDLRDGNAAGSLNSALDSASTAADEIARSVRELPALVARLQQTAARADTVLGAYGQRSEFNTEAINVMRELRRATTAFGSLARMIERNPQSFILGR